MNLTAICISKDPVSLEVGVPFYNYTEGWKYIPHWPRVKTVERIEYLASRRNGCVKKALEVYPETTDLLMVDTYYLSQSKQIEELVKEYHPGKMILGASTWYLDPSKIPARRCYWDTWTNPEFLNAPLSRTGLWRTSGAGGLCLFPRWAWERQGFGVPYPFPESGCEVNYLSRCPHIDTFISFNVKAWRDPPEELKNKPFSKRLRTTLAIRTRFKRMPLYK